LTASATPAVLTACPACQHNRPRKDSSLCRPCKGRLSDADQDWLLAAWDAYLFAFAATTLAAPAGHHRRAG
jgi:hypothetical protein